MYSIISYYLTTKFNQILFHERSSIKCDQILHSISLIKQVCFK